MVRELKEKFKTTEVKHFLINQKVLPDKIGEQNNFQVENFE